jgi:putative spermidine/putrescine transport system ATP-binding protein
MGDHNVISGRISGTEADGVTIAVPEGGNFTASGRPAASGEDVDIAVRTDRVRLAETSGPGLGFTGIVTNVEYLGSSVKLQANGAGIEDFTALISDTDFFARPVTVGEVVPFAWDAGDAIVLGRLD